MMNNTQKPMTPRKTSQRLTVEEIRKTYESMAKPESPKKMKKSKVKQLAAMFNMKITQIMKHDSKKTQVKRDSAKGRYAALVNEFSPEPRTTMNALQPKPIAITRYHYIKHKVAASSPRMRLKCKAQNRTKYGANEDQLNKLSVKDKAQLYMEFVNNLTKEEEKNANLKEVAQGEVIIEQQAAVKDLVEELNGTCVMVETSTIKTVVPTMTMPASAQMADSEASSTSSALSSTPTKLSSIKEEIQSGLSSLPKTPRNGNVSLTNDFDFVKPLKSLRRKKVRKSSHWKNYLSLKEINILSSTDSESESKYAKMKTNKHKQDLTQSLPSHRFVSSFKEFNNETPKRMPKVPHAIKLDYSLCGPELEVEVEKTEDKALANTESFLHEVDSKRIPQIKATSDSSTDQGFETESPEQGTPKDVSSSKILENSITTSRLMSAYTFDFSTPIKDQFQQSFGCTNSAKQQLFSPIDKPTKTGRRSLYNTESHQTSIAMPAIKEDHSLEYQDAKSSQTVTANKQPCLPKASSMGLTFNLWNLINENPSCNNNEKFSKFWLKSGDFFIALDIYYIEAERVRLLHNIFIQTSCDTKDLQLGIDDYKFSLNANNDHENIVERLSADKGSSHYWFSTGDLAIPFSGKFLSGPKIQRLFQFIQSSVAESGVLRFGVDEVEFSNFADLCAQSRKLSMESNLRRQSGCTDSLEDLGKYSWPQLKPVKVTDLDESSLKGEDVEHEHFEVIEAGKFSRHHNNFPSMDSADSTSPRNSSTTISIDSYCEDYDNEPLDQLFKTPYHQQPIPKIHPDLKTYSSSRSEQNQQLRHQHLSTLIQERLSLPNTKSSHLPQEVLNNLQSNPEYLSTLKSIVSDISHKGCSDNLKDCSVQQLEDYMYFLNHYTDICRNSSKDQVDSILEALDDFKPVLV